MYFLIAPDSLAALQDAARSPSAPTASERAAFIAQAPGTSLRRAGDTAEITVEGILTAKPDLLSMIFGGGNTTFGSIRSALAEAKADPTIKRVRMHVDSPGGEVSGLFETLADLQSFTKPIEVRAARAQSAAFAIASAAGKIVATTPAAPFGSVGVATSIFVTDRIVDITNTESPDKRPDVRTDEGQQVIREHLDDIFSLFVEAIAKGRNTTPATVVERFGKGRTLLARDAKRAGMIDNVLLSSSEFAGTGVDGLLAKINAIKTGALKPVPGESRSDFLDRVSAGDYMPPEPAHQSRDIGDEVVAIMEANNKPWIVDLSKEREKRKKQQLKPPKKKPQAKDIGDEIVALMEGERSFIVEENRRG